MVFKAGSRLEGTPRGDGVLEDYGCEAAFNLLGGLGGRLASRPPDNLQASTVGGLVGGLVGWPIWLAYLLKRGLQVLERCDHVPPG